MKFLKILLVVVASLVSVQAQSYYTTNNLAATNHTIFSSGKTIISLQLWSTNTSPTIVQLRDGDLVSTNSQTTNYVRYTTNIVTETVSVFTGLTNLSTNTVIRYDAAVIAASTTRPVVPKLTIVAPGSSVLITETLVPNLMFVNKLTLSNNLAGLNAIIQYRDPN